LPVPAVALKVALGEASSVLLSSQRVIPEKAVGLGFTFEFSTIDSALTDICARASAVNIRGVERA
jgi:NAD dependent epimerase/dehydratase family enzyme